MNIVWVMDTRPEAREKAIVLIGKGGLLPYDGGFAVARHWTS